MRAAPKESTPISERWRRDRRLDAVLWGLVFAGIALRAIQYLADISLFIDEAMLALNIRDHPPMRLVLGPLDFFQVAPPVFLLLAKMIGAPLGYVEYALRLPAFVSSILALAAFVALAKKTLRPHGVLLAVVLMALAPALIKFGAQVKQYSTDVLTTVGLLLVTVYLIETAFRTKNLMIAAAVGAFCVWLSHTAIMVALACGLSLVTVVLVRRPSVSITRIAFLAFVWGASSLGSLLIATGGPVDSTRQAMESFWQSNFMPFPPSTLAELVKPVRIVRGLYWNGLGLWGVATLALVGAMLGIVSFWRRGRWDIALVILAPIITVLTLSYAERYPFSGRLLLFIYPCLILLLAEGVGIAVATLSGKPIWIRALPILAFAVPPILVQLRNPPPWYNEEMKPVLAYVADRRQPTDLIYAYWGAEPAMQYYAPRYGLTRDDWITGRGIYDKASNYQTEIDRLPGASRVWLIFSHDDVVAGSRTFMTSQLDTLGVRLDSVAFPTHPQGSGSKAYLYDLSGRIRD